MAVWSLAGRPADAVRLLSARLRQAKPVAAEVALLVTALGSDDATVRDRAEAALGKFGEAAVPALRNGLVGGTAEVRRRVERLLKAVEGPLSDPARLREVRAVEALEYAGTKEARAVIGWLAGGAPEARLTREARWALHRLTKRPVSGAPK